MTDINAVTLGGRLVRDAELKYSGSGSPWMIFSIATNTPIKRGDQWEDEGNFFDCTLSGKLAEAIATKMTKGTKIHIQGTLKQSKWTDQGGQQKSKIGVKVKTIDIGAPPRGSSAPSEAPPGAPNQGNPKYQGDEHGGEFQDDIPF